MKSLLLFVAGGLLFGAVSLGGGYGIWGVDSLTQGSAAFALAFFPAAATLAGVIFGFRSAPDMVLLASLGGTAVRMAIALCGGLLLTSSEPETFGRPFWSWLVLFYLGLLGLEITLLVRQQPDAEGPPKY